MFLSPAGPEHTCPCRPAGAQASTGIAAGVSIARGGLGGGWCSAGGGFCRGGAQAQDPCGQNRSWGRAQAQDPHGQKSPWGVGRTNDNENTMTQNIWDAAKAVLRRKFTAI